MRAAVNALAGSTLAALAAVLALQSCVSATATDGTWLDVLAAAVWMLLAVGAGWLAVPKEWR